MGVDIDLILQRLIRIYIHQVMIDGCLHADSHPGNILVDAKGRIIILDFGMVIRIDSYLKQHLIRYAIPVAHNDIDGIVHEMYELQIVEPGTNKALLRDLAVVMLEIQEQRPFKTPCENSIGKNCAFICIRSTCKQSTPSLEELPDDFLWE